MEGIESLKMTELSDSKKEPGAKREVDKGLRRAEFPVHVGKTRKPRECPTTQTWWFMPR